jgi:hypothetical protein
MKVYIGPYVTWTRVEDFMKHLPFLSDLGRAALSDWLEETWVGTALLKWNESKKVKQSIRIDPWDTWSMDNTLSQIIVPMLKQLKVTKQGSPFIENEDVPEELRFEESGSYDSVWDERWHSKWEWVLDEMIFAHEHTANYDWEDQFHTNGFDKEGYDKVARRIKNGLRLFGKYYQALWD